MIRQATTFGIRCFFRQIECREPNSLLGVAIWARFHAFSHYGPRVYLWGCSTKPRNFGAPPDYASGDLRVQWQVIRFIGLPDFPSSQTGNTFCGVGGAPRAASDFPETRRHPAPQMPNLIMDRGGSL